MQISFDKAGLLLFVVAPLVVLHVPLSGELLRAERALERFLLRVNSDVNNQVWALGESLRAVWVRALERLCAIMELQVRSQAAPSRETLSAACLRTEVA